MHRMKEGALGENVQFGVVSLARTHSEYARSYLVHEKNGGTENMCIRSRRNENYQIMRRRLMKVSVLGKKIWQGHKFGPIDDKCLTGTKKI
jgi:hypothetical protein